MAAPLIQSLDHLVLTVRSLEATRAFYCDTLGMDWISFGEGRHALGFGVQKINLHVAGAEFEPKAAHPTPGSADLCFLVARPLAEIEAALAAAEIPLLEGPVPRTGATGPIQSLYVRDPDGNLIELSTPA
ncbi:MAG: VOC family protein [Pseudomonadota bacterium]